MSQLSNSIPAPPVTNSRPAREVFLDLNNLALNKNCIWETTSTLKSVQLIALIALHSTSALYQCTDALCEKVVMH